MAGRLVLSQLIGVRVSVPQRPQPTRQELGWLCSASCTSAYRASAHPSLVKTGGSDQHRRWAHDEMAQETQTQKARTEDGSSSGTGKE